MIDEFINYDNCAVTLIYKLRKTMKKTILVLMISMLTLVGKAYAEISYGFSASLTQIDASGTETEGGERSTGDADNLVVVPSLFLEYGFSLFSEV